MLLTLRRYFLDDHILSDVANLSTYWVRLDNIMVTWILNTLSRELHEIIQKPTEAARQAWLALEAQFLGSHESRILQLDAWFCVFKQGDFSVSDYYRWMKSMANDFHALRETITDHHLVLNLLQDLNKRFDHMNIFIKRLQSFPSFHIICNNLKLEDIMLDNSAS
jgi:hypothetical protein